ncbi:MAG: hypothetical protein IIB72_08140 [Proteobacteria bacterium]|nr:hypothetical protein [Pseudomonadota bacterium]
MASCLWLIVAWRLVEIADYHIPAPSSYLLLVHGLLFIEIDDSLIDGLLQRVFPIPKRLLLEEPKGNKPFALLAEPKKEDILQPHDMWVVTSLPRKRELVKKLIKEGKGNDDPAIAGTRWAAFNGVAEFTDYLNGWDSRRTRSLLFGEGRDLKQRAWDLLTVKS